MYYYYKKNKINYQLIKYHKIPLIPNKFLKTR